MQEQEAAAISKAGRVRARLRARQANPMLVTSPASPSTGLGLVVVCKLEVMEELQKGDGSVSRAANFLAALLHVGPRDAPRPLP